MEPLNKTVLNKNMLSVLVVMSMVWMVIGQNIDEETPTFRILAPEFICPKDDTELIDKPDETVIMVQTPTGARYNVSWQVRWTPLPAPTQRITLMVWRAVRQLEAKLNAPQPMPYFYVIDNSELLHGIDYRFTVTASTPTSHSHSKDFHIDNSRGGKDLSMIEGTVFMFSINVLGSQVAYADVEYAVEAEVTMCQPTEDYHFIWSIRSEELNHEVVFTEEKGGRLVVAAGTLRADVSYETTVQCVRTSDNEFVNRASLPFEVLRRGLEVYLSADYLVVGFGEPFCIAAVAANHNFYEDELSFHWACSFETKPCDFFESRDVDLLFLDSGLPGIGEYVFELTASVRDEKASAKMTIRSLDSTHPVLQIEPVPRVLNEQSTVSLVANVSNVAPSCHLNWYFAAEGQVFANEHGEPLNEMLNVTSLEENFLNELADYTNETEWRQVTAQAAAVAGRARFVAACGCSLTFSCGSEGTVYADLLFELNRSPEAGNVTVSPTSGVALETVHRISTLPAVDPDSPIKYSFYCGLGESSLLLALYYEHLSLETVLPYVEGGTPLWVEACDVRGACSVGPTTLLHQTPGKERNRIILFSPVFTISGIGLPLSVYTTRAPGRTVAALIDSARGHLSRCEIPLLRKVTASALVTYMNTKLTDHLAQFSKALTEMLANGDAEKCSNLKNTEYAEFIHALASIGFDS